MFVAVKQYASLLFTHFYESILVFSDGLESMLCLTLKSTLLGKIWKGDRTRIPETFHGGI